MSWLHDTAGDAQLADRAGTIRIGSAYKRDCKAGRAAAGFAEEDCPHAVLNAQIIVLHILHILAECAIAHN
jgi:hypothetical protein